jgi:hypothetical protein
MFLILPVCVLADPTVSNIRASQRENSKMVDIVYDVTYSGGSNISVSCEISTDGGSSYDVSAESFIGNGYGSMVTTGVDRVITWNAGIDWDENYSETMKVRITATAPRFTDNGDGTVTDNETGLMWKQSPLLHDSSPIMTYANVGEECVALGDGWRPPTLTELEGLLDTTRTPALPAGHPFVDIRADLYYWTGTVHSGVSSSNYIYLDTLSFLAGQYSYGSYPKITGLGGMSAAALPVKSIY